jgi:predicted amidohydrolase
LSIVPAAVGGGRNHILFGAHLQLHLAALGQIDVQGGVASRNRDGLLVSAKPIDGDIHFVIADGQGKYLKSAGGRGNQILLHALALDDDLGARNGDPLVIQNRSRNGAVDRGEQFGMNG